MEKKNQEIKIEYQYVPSPDAEELLEQVYDLILGLILADIENEIEQDGGKSC